MSETALTVQPHEPRGQVHDLRSGVMQMDAANMMSSLSEYAERRRTFREWLKAQLVEGVHYGYVPGCEPPETRTMDGVTQFKMRFKKGEQWAEKWVPITQWTHKPVLYKAGAEFIVDLMNLRSEWESDLEAWEQLGKPKDTFVRRCKLYGRGTGELIGEGTGARKVGERAMTSANATVKMADKSALVAAVLNSYGLSDLFTQDEEDIPSRPPGQAPDARGDAPRAQPRGRRVVADDIKGLITKWKDVINRDGTPEDFAEWVFRTAGVPQAGARKESAWSIEQMRTCEHAIKVALGVPPEGGTDDIPY